MCIRDRHLYYQGLISRVYNSGDLRFAFAAELMDAQGCRIPLRFCYERTDAYSGGTIGYDTQFLENFDSRKFPEGWSSAEFEDAGWKTPAAAEWADYRLYLQPTRMLCGERIKPEKVEIYEDGSIRIDVGEEVAGSPVSYTHLRAVILKWWIRMTGFRRMRTADCLRA